MKRTLVLVSLLVLFASGASAANLTVNGAQTYQTIDGYGVNINAGWWNNGEVKPAIDLLVDQAGANIFRCVIEEMDWEATNDDADPNHFNWTYYNTVYTNARFQGVWNTLHYLNQKGVTNGLVISFMGHPPAWMGANSTVDSTNDDEFVETMASLLYYARNTAGISFNLISPINEPDTGGVEGPNIGSATQMADILHKLAVKLDAIGMSDVRILAPEAAYQWGPYFDALVADPVIVAKLKAWAVHNYQNNPGGYQGDYQTKIGGSPYPNKPLWVTETAGYDNLLSQIPGNPTVHLVWDGFDSLYQHAIRAGRGTNPPNDSVGIEPPLIAYDTTTHLFTPRKSFYQHAQLFKFVRPGAVRIGATNDDSNFTIYAFRDPATGRLTIAGRNGNWTYLTLNGTLNNLPGSVATLEFYRTDATLNLYHDTNVIVSGNSFSVSIPGNTYFTLTTPVAKLDTHEVNVDGTGNLLSWVAPQDHAYATVAKLSADFIKAAMIGPIDSANGLPMIYTHSEYDPTNFTGSGWPNHPAGKHSMLADSMLHYYQYSGDTGVLNAVEALLDYQLTSKGTTPTNYYWGNVPWSTSAAYNAQYGTDDVSEGAGMLEPDKIGELGFFGYLRFYEITGNTNYRNAAIACADALAAHVRAGSATQSPWPFRANAQTGALHPTVPEDYCAHTIAPIRLFDELIRLNLGNVAAYQTARTTAWNWLMTDPMVNNRWNQYFEDDMRIPDPFANLNQYVAGQTARYLLEHPEIDTNWQAHSSNLLAWIETTFGGSDVREQGLQYGARTIYEQNEYPFKMGSHTGRFAALNALYAERTGDLVAKDKAFRSLNWCSYMARTNGAVIEGPAEFIQNYYNWYSDGHGDYIRHFMIAMGAFPEWAPADENHLLRSSSVVRAIAYTNSSITYTTFDNAATEVFRLASVPTNVLAGGVVLPQLTILTNQGWTYDGATGVLRVRHDATNQIQVLLNSSNLPPQVSFTAPTGGATFTAPALVTLTASATGVSGMVTNVVFFAGTNKLTSFSSAPYTFTWPNVPIGSYTFTATAFDDNGRSNTSAPVSIIVTAPGGTATLGNTNEGNATDTITDNSGAYINACRFQATANATVTQMRAKVGAITGRYQLAIYSDNGGTANALLAATVTLTNVTSGWQNFPLTNSLALTSGNYYWLAIWSDDVNASISADTGGQEKFAAYPFGNWPNPINLTGSGGFTYCIYATGPAQTAFQQWKSNYDIPANTPNTSDSDGDGIPLLLEYTYGLNPLTNSPAGSTTGKLQSNYLTLTYQKIKAATDITCTAEVSSNVTGPWLSGSNDVEQLWQVGDGLTTQTITARDKTGAPNASSRFMRLKVTQP